LSSLIYCRFTGYINIRHQNILNYVLRINRHTDRNKREGILYDKRTCI
jgi:hypothetical protein